MRRLLNRSYTFLLIILILSGCKSIVNNQANESESHKDEIIEIETSPSQTSTPAPVESNEFSVIFDNKFISLRAWDKDNYITDTLGKPLEETIEVLGSSADTHAGSSLKTLKYNGLTLKLFSPKSNGKEFWLLSMTITDNKYQTFRGITIGSTVPEIKQAYENVIQALDGRTDANNCAYTINDLEQYIWFEVDSGVVKEIKIYIEIP